MKFYRGYPFFLNIFRHIVAGLIIKQLQDTINKFIVALLVFPSRFLIFRRGLNFFLNYYCFLNYYF